MGLLDPRHRTKALQWLNFNAELDRDDMPASIENTCWQIFKLWFKNNKYYRLGGPNVVSNKTGEIILEQWLMQITKQGPRKYHRVNGPSYICYREGKINSESWYFENKLHRIGGPACIEYHDDGRIKCEKWYVDGKLFRSDGPVKISYYPSGKRELYRGMKVMTTTMKAIRML